MGPLAAAASEAVLQAAAASYASHESRSSRADDRQPRSSMIGSVRSSVYSCLQYTVVETLSKDSKLARAHVNQNIYMV